MALPQEFCGGVEHHRQRLRVGHGLQPCDSLLGRAAIGLERGRRAEPGVHDGHLALLGQLLQQPEAQLAAGLQAGLVLVAILHARGGVEHQGRRHGRLLAADGPGQFHAGPGQGERQQRDGPGPQQQQQQMPQLQPPLVHVVPLLEEPQRGELQQRRPAAHDQVQHDRQRHQRGPGQK